MVDASTGRSAAQRGLLGAYPHVAACPTCLGYLGDWLDVCSPAQVVPAVLAHHDSGHRHDPLAAASQYCQPVLRDRLIDSQLEKSWVIQTVPWESW
jgi:hypothetical protein